MAAHIGKLIGELREERGWSKKRLAREAGISDAYLVQIEKGVRTPSEKVMRHLARVFGLPASVLLFPAGAYPSHVAEFAARLAKDGLAEFRTLHNRDATKVESWAIMDAALSEAEMTIADAEDFRDNGDDGPESWYEENGLWPVAAAVRNPRLMPDTIPGPEGWSDLSPRDQRLVQQLINRLRSTVRED